jgi:hypothetical protein
MSKLKVEKAQLNPIMVVIKQHNHLINRELGYESLSYHIRTNVANVFEI